MIFSDDPPTDAALVNEAYAMAMLGELEVFFDGCITDPAGSKQRLLKGLPILRKTRQEALAALDKSATAQKGHGI